MRLLSFTLHLIPSLNPSGTFPSSSVPPTKTPHPWWGEYWLSFSSFHHTLLLLLLTLRCCQQSPGLVLRAPPVRPVCSGLWWELHSSTHHSGWEAYCLLSFFCSLCFPPQQDRKTEEIQQERQTEGARESGRRQAERDVRISPIFFFFFV